MKNYINEENEVSMFDISEMFSKRKNLVEMHEADKQKYLYGYVDYNNKSARIDHDKCMRKLDDYAHECWLSRQQEQVKQKSKLSVIKYGRTK